MLHNAVAPPTELHKAREGGLSCHGIMPSPQQTATLVQLHEIYKLV